MGSGQRRLDTPTAPLHQSKQAAFPQRPIRLRPAAGCRLRFRDVLSKPSGAPARLKRVISATAPDGSAPLLRQHLLALHRAAGLQPAALRGRGGRLPGRGGGLALRLRPAGAPEGPRGHGAGGGSHQHPARRPGGRRPGSGSRSWQGGRVPAGPGPGPEIRPSTQLQKDPCDGGQSSCWLPENSCGPTDGGHLRAEPEICCRRSLKGRHDGLDRANQQQDHRSQVLPGLPPSGRCNTGEGGKAKHQAANGPFPLSNHGWKLVPEPPKVFPSDSSRTGGSGP